MKKWLKKKSNILFILILGFALYQQFPVLKNNFEQENKTIPTRKVLSYTSDKQVDFPPTGKKAIAIFWATWCGPCKIEMNRLKSSVESGSIPRDAIFAINPFETEGKIKKFMAEHFFPFVFIESSLGNDLGVTVTPTTIFIDNGKLESMSSGMSLWGIWKAEFFI